MSQDGWICTWGFARSGCVDSQATTDCGKRVMATEAGKMMRRMTNLEMRREMGPRRKNDKPGDEERDGPKEVSKSSKGDW